VDDWERYSVDSVTFGSWRIVVNREATEHAYTTILEAGPEECGCAYCRNFVAARAHAYPPEATDLFTRLGIDPCYEAEVVDYHIVTPDSNHRLIGGWFHFVGTVEEGPDGTYEPLVAGFEIGFTRHAGVVEHAFAGQQIAQIEFLTRIPWVLDEPTPD